MYIAIRSEAHCFKRGLSCFKGLYSSMKQTYFVYLDEFGHIGPFVSRDHDKHNTFPVFGYGGIILPADQVRPFSSWFYKLKCNLLSWEIAQSSEPPFRWEKKGAALYTTKNIINYRELRQATFRLFNKIEKSGGYVFYVGIEKTAEPTQHKPNAMMFAILREAVKRLDDFCVLKDSGFIVFIDHRDEKLLREALVGVTQQEMYGSNPRRTLLEAPTQVESNLYQLVQAADWICGILGRLKSYEACPDEYADYDWSEKYFAQRLKMISLRSGVRKITNLPMTPLLDDTDEDASPPKLPDTP